LTHQELTNYILHNVDTISPYKSGTLQYLYHAGFLASVIATLIKHDSQNAQIFKRIVAQAQRDPAVSNKPNSNKGH
jgi:hypothetical protein